MWLKVYKKDRKIGGEKQMKIMSSLLLIIITLMICSEMHSLVPVYGLFMAVIGAMPMLLLAIIVIIMIAKWR